MPDFRHMFGGMATALLLWLAQTSCAIAQTATVEPAPPQSAAVKSGGPLPPKALLPGKPAVSYFVVPSGMEEGQLSKKNGCWAKLHDEDSLQGDALTIFGPVEIANASGAGVFDISWVDRISRIVAGPKAQLAIYDNTEFRDLVATIKPGQDLNVNKSLNYFTAIKSLRLTCTK